VSYFLPTAKVWNRFILRGVLLFGAGVMAALAPTPGKAQTDNPQDAADGEANIALIDRGIGLPEAVAKATLDRIWDYSNAYRNDDARFIQELSLLGRYHGQYWGVASNQGNADGWEDRRIWAGARMRFLDELTLASNFNLDPKPGSTPTRNRDYIDTLTLAWLHEDKIQLTLGQQKPGFTYEYDTSSNRILTLERSMLVNQIAPEKSPGLMFEQKLNDFRYRIGGYSGQPLGESIDDLFGLLALEYDFGKITGHERMGIQFYYLYSPEKKNEAIVPYRHSYSISSDFQEGPVSFLAQLMMADSFGDRPDVWGFTLMPAKFIHEEKLQLVARYQYANSDGADGLQLPNRYERQVPNLHNNGLGDRYHAGYLGLNYYIYGNRLKLMAGIEYSDMSGGSKGGDFSGWSGFGGLRVIF